MTMYIAIPLKYLDEECEIHTLYTVQCMPSSKWRIGQCLHKSLVCLTLVIIIVHIFKVV